MPPQRSGGRAPFRPGACARCPTGAVPGCCCSLVSDRAGSVRGLPAPAGRRRWTCPTPPSNACLSARSASLPLTGSASELSWMHQQQVAPSLVSINASRLSRHREATSPTQGRSGYPGRALVTRVVELAPIVGWGRGEGAAPSFPMCRTTPKRVRKNPPRGGRSQIAEGRCRGIRSLLGAAPVRALESKPPMSMALRQRMASRASSARRWAAMVDSRGSGRWPNSSAKRAASAALVKVSGSGVI